MKLINEKNRIVSNTIECVEQDLVKKYIKPEDLVLELGARYGSVSVTTNKIVKDKKSHYVVEPDKLVWDALETNMKNNNCDFNIIKGIIGKKKYRLEGRDYSTHSVEDNNSDIEIFDLPDINFNTLIVDCEGYLEIFYNENKPLFHKLEKIILEEDMPQICNYQYVFDELKKLNFELVEKIKEPTCANMYHYVFIKKPKILFCSLSDRLDFSKPMFDHLQQYCNKHNYQCVLEDKILDDSRAPSWSKIKLLQREMKSNPDIPLIVWIDDDILITNKQIKFEELIERYPFKNILISREVIPPFNCGVLVCKNNIETYNYLTHIWSLCEKYPDYKHKPNWEQEIFIRDYYNDQSYIFPIPYKIIQSFYRTQNKDWKIGDFSAHLTGMSMDNRIKLRDEILNLINKKDK